MVMQRKRQINAAANVPVGAPQPSHVRELLVTLKTRLESRLYGNEADDRADAAGTNGMVARANMTDLTETVDDIHDTVVERAMQGNIARQLDQVKETLARIDDGKYGICANCLQPIAADRLVVRPFSTHCMECQNQVDRGTLPRS